MADTHFDGLSAVTAFDAIGGNAYTGGQKVPVENQEGGSGSRDSHWRLAVFTNELMTGLLTTGANPLSRVTVASLGDLGYSVDEGGADAFQLFLAAAARGGGGGRDVSAGRRRFARDHLSTGRARTRPRCVAVMAGDPTRKQHYLPQREDASQPLGSGSVPTRP